MIAAPVPRARRAYDHRLREHVFRTGSRTLPRRLQIPRSTVATWRLHGPRPVITAEPFDADREALVNKIEKLEHRARVLAAVVRLLLALLHASGFVLARHRLPEGAAKTRILRAVASAEPFLPLVMILRVLGLAPSRFHAWRRAAPICRLDDRSSCPRTSAGQLTAAEIATIKQMVLAPEYRHMPLATMALNAQRIGKVFASVTSWSKLIRERGWRRPRLRVHPYRPSVGVRAIRPNEIWHIDVTVVRLLDGTKAFIHAVIDNFSRKILAWTVEARLAPSSTCNVLVAAGKHLVVAGRPVLYADSGIENLNAAVDATLRSACLDRILAQVEVAFSNSMIEAFWRSLKHQWLFLNPLDSIPRLRTLVEFFVEEHNAKMPHAAFRGQTPDEMYFGTAPNLPDDLAAAREAARDQRLAANRAASCGQCPTPQPAPPIKQIPP